MTNSLASKGKLLNTLDHKSGYWQTKFHTDSLEKPLSILLQLYINIFDEKILCSYIYIYIYIYTWTGHNVLAIE